MDSRRWTGTQRTYCPHTFGPQGKGGRRRRSVSWPWSCRHIDGGNTSVRLSTVTTTGTYLTYIYCSRKFGETSSRCRRNTSTLLGGVGPRFARPAVVAWGQHVSVGEQQTAWPQHTDRRPLLKQQWRFPSQQWVSVTEQHRPLSQRPIPGAHGGGAAAPDLAGNSPPNADAAAEARSSLTTARHDVARPTATASRSKSALPPTGSTNWSMRPRTDAAVRTSLAAERAAHTVASQLQTAK